MSLKKNLFKNGVASMLQKIVLILQQLLLVPFFISAWGTEYYGEWLTISIIPSILALTNLGVGSSAANSFVLEYSSGNMKSAANIGVSGFFMITIVIIFGISISGLILHILNIYNIFEDSVIEKSDILWSISFITIAGLLNFYQQLYEGYFRAARKASMSINLLTIFTFTNLFVGFLVLKNGGGVLHFAFVNLLVSMIFNPIFGFLALKKLSISKDFKGSCNKQDIMKISKKGFGYLIHPTWQAIYFQGTTFIVRILLGAEAVALYNTVRTVMRSVSQFFSLVNVSVFPELQFEIGKGNMILARKIFRAALALVVVGAIFGMLFLGLFGQSLYSIWTNKSLIPPISMWFIFISGVFFNAIWWTSGMVYNAFNLPYKYAFAGLISSAISLMVTYFLCKYYGLVGGAIGSVILDVLMAIYIFPSSCKLMGQSISSFIFQLREDLRLKNKFKNV
jgi:O-antigen/teichoic acid export membrane protein